MGGYGSGRTGGRPTIEDGRTLDLPLLFRKRCLQDGGSLTGGVLTWSSNGNPIAKIGFSYDLTDAEYAWLKLSFTLTPYGGQPQQIEQRITLSSTNPNYGGRRWWMLCPVTGERVAKMHMPPGGGKFASRNAWRLGYHSQRMGQSDQVFEELFRLQRKLGSPEGWEAGLRRPKGMWRRTFDRHLNSYLALDEQCTGIMERRFRHRW